MRPQFELRPITKYLIAEFERAVLAWERGEKVKVLFIVPPRCGKSELISRNGAPWIVGRNPERALLALSLSQNFASDIGESVLDAIQSEEYQGTFPGVKLSKRSQSKKDFKIESDEAPDIEPTPSEAASSEAGQEGEGVASGERVQQARKTTLDIAEPTDNSAQRQREEREAQRLRMAALQAQLAAERAARTVEPQSEPNRFDLLECDPKADPAVSIAAWEARQKRSTVRLMPKPQPQPQPLPAPCRLFEVVDAEAEGLRPGAVFTALLGRALNPNC